jgi:acyl dehydratase
MRIGLGEQFGPVTVAIEEHVAKAYAFAQDDYDWLLGTTDGCVPALVLANRLLRVYEERYERHANHGALHTRQELWYHQPVGLGDTVTVTGRYVEAYERRGWTYLVLESTARDSRGEPVITSFSTEAMPATLEVEVVGHPVPPSERARQRPPERPSRVVPSTEAPEPGATGLPLVVGALTPVLRTTVRQEQMSVFSGAGAYERNFHTDLEKARAAGFERPIAQAMQTACHIGAWLTGLYGPGWARTGWQDSRFVAPVAAGERLTVAGRVTGVEPTLAGARVSLDLWVLDESSRATAVGRASGVVPAGPPQGGA